MSPAGMKVYIDGSDLLQHLAEVEDPIVVQGDRDSSRDNLARWFARYCENRDCAGILVFDENGPGEMLSPTQNVGNVRVVNMPYGTDARSEIAGPANRDAVQMRVFVVTSDRRTAEALAHGKAHVHRPAHFMARARSLMGKDTGQFATEPDEKFSGLTEDEVDFWMEYFDQEG